MKQLVLLYWGCVFLMYLSQTYHPVQTQLDGPQTGKRHFMLRRADIFMIVVIAWMTRFSFLRTSYNDTVNYITFFREVEPLTELIRTEDFFSFGNNPFHEMYKAFIHDLTNNYHIYFLFPALLSNYAIIKLFKRYSNSLSFSMIVFLGLGTYIMYMAALKQGLAIFFLVLSVPYAIDKNTFRFYFLVFIATMFHTHAFVFAFLPFLFRIPWGKLTWLLVVAVVLIMATYNTTMGAVMNFALSIGVNVADFELFDGHSINIIRIIVYSIPAAMALFFRKRLFSNSTRAENLFANMSIVSVLILSIGLIQGANLFARTAAYFEFAIAISLPWMIEKIFTKDSARFVKMFGTVLFFGYFYYEFAISKSFGSGYRAITLWQFIQSLLG